MARKDKTPSYEPAPVVPKADAAALPDDPGSHVGTTAGDRGSQTTGNESQPFPDAPAQGGEGHAAVGHPQAGWPASDAGAGGRAGDGAVAGAEGEPGAEDAQRGGGAALGPGWGLGAREDRDACPPRAHGEDDDAEQ